MESRDDGRGDRSRLLASGRLSVLGEKYRKERARLVAGALKGNQAELPKWLAWLYASENTSANLYNAIRQVVYHEETIHRLENEKLTLEVLEWVVASLERLREEQERRKKYDRVLRHVTLFFVMAYTVAMLMCYVLLSTYIGG